MVGFVSILWLERLAKPYSATNYKKKIPAWLNIQPQPEKSLIEIDKLGLDAYAFNGLDYSLN